MKKRISKKMLTREIVRLESHIQWIEGCVNNLIKYMVEDIYNGNTPVDIRKIRKQRVNELAILFDFKTKEELRDLAKMLSKKPAKKVKDESTKI